MKKCFAKVTSVAEKAGVTITAGDISTCRRLLFAGVGSETLPRLFVVKLSVSSLDLKKP